MTKRGKPRARANGEGTIYQTETGSFVAQYTTPTGQRRSKTHTSQRKAKQWLTQQLRDIDTGDYIEPPELSLGKWLEKFVDVYKIRSVGPKTLESYAYSRARLPQSLLRMPIGQIMPADIQGALNGIAGGRRTVEITRTFLLMAFDQAVTDRMVKYNPVKTTVLPAESTEPKAKAMTKEDEARFVKLVTAPIRISADGTIDKFDLASQTIRDALFFALRTGVSREECVSLMWSDVSQKIHIKGTKNKFRNRLIPFPDDEIRSMLNRRKFTANSEYVFASRSGRKLDGSNLLRWMSTNTDYTVHDLRHTYITRAAQAGVNPRVLQALTGHAKLETLLAVYTHVSEQDTVDAAAKIASYCKSTANLTENSELMAK
jgi:integrase